MEQFYIYLWSISGNFAMFLLITGMFLLIISPFLFFILDSIGYMEYKDVIPIFTKTVISGLVIFVFAILIPSKQDLALLFMYPYIKQGTETVIKSETLNKMKQITNLYLDEQIKNLKDKEVR